MNGRRTTRRRAPRRGFTLIEMLLASLLLVVLLSATWSLLGMYSRGFASNTRRTDEAQLVRAWLQQLADDLALALAVEPERAVAAVPQAGGRFPGAFVGTSSSLSFDAGAPLSPDAVAASRPAQSRAAGDERGAQSLLAGELRRVTYALQRVRRFRGDTRSADPTIACRREAPWLTADRPAGRQSARRTARQASGPGEVYLNELDSVSPGVMRLLATVLDSAGDSPVQPVSARGRSWQAESLPRPAVADGERTAAESIALVPEIEQLEFRYFDGAAWARSWDSRQRQCLPAVVEVTFRLRQPERRQIDTSAPPADARRRREQLSRETLARRERPDERDSAADARFGARRGDARERLPGEWRALLVVAGGAVRPGAALPADTHPPRVGRSLARSQP